MLVKSSLADVGNLTDFLDGNPSDRFFREKVYKSIFAVSASLESEEDMYYTNNLLVTGYTDAVPDIYFEPADRQGTIEEIRYQSKDYASDSSKIEKVAYVYLPYSYNEDDSDTCYDVFYFMHGWGGVAGDIFTDSDSKNILDNMIEKGDMKPMIFVAATFDGDTPQSFHSAGYWTEPENSVAVLIPLRFPFQIMIMYEYCANQHRKSA